MFKNISLPGGISTKATEYKELAAKGDKWESPVFGIGSAKESSDIPKLANVSRKPHSTAQGVVRGGNHPTSGQASSTNNSNYNQNSGYNSSQTGPSSGFGNQVDQAFDTKGNPVASLSTNGTSGVGSNGISNSMGNNALNNNSMGNNIGSSMIYDNVTQH